MSMDSMYNFKIKRRSAKTKAVEKFDDGGISSLRRTYNSEVQNYLQKVDELNESRSRLEEMLCHLRAEEGSLVEDVDEESHSMQDGRLSVQSWLGSQQGVELSENQRSFDVESLEPDNICLSDSDSIVPPSWKSGEKEEEECSFTFREPPPKSNQLQTRPSRRREAHPESQLSVPRASRSSSRSRVPSNPPRHGDVPQDDLIEISAHLSNKRTKSKSVSIESNTVLNNETGSFNQVLRDLPEDVLLTFSKKPHKKQSSTTEGNKGSVASNSSVWTSEEKILFENAMADAMALGFKSDLDLWSAIAKVVKTKTWQQCAERCRQKQKSERLERASRRSKVTNSELTKTPVRMTPTKKSDKSRSENRPTLAQDLHFQFSDRSKSVSKPSKKERLLAVTAETQCHSAPQTRSSRRLKVEPSPSEEAPKYRHFPESSEKKGTGCYVASPVKSCKEKRASLMEDIGDGTLYSSRPVKVGQIVNEDSPDRDVQHKRSSKRLPLGQTAIGAKERMSQQLREDSPSEDNVTYGHTRSHQTKVQTRAERKSRRNHGHQTFERDEVNDDISTPKPFQNIENNSYLQRCERSMRRSSGRSGGKTQSKASSKTPGGGKYSCSPQEFVQLSNVQTSNRDTTGRSRSNRRARNETQPSSDNNALSLECSPDNPKTSGRRLKSPEVPTVDGSLKLAGKHTMKRHHQLSGLARQVNQGYSPDIFDEVSSLSSKSKKYRIPLIQVTPLNIKRRENISNSDRVWLLSDGEHKRSLSASQRKSRKETHKFLQNQKLDYVWPVTKRSGVEYGEKAPAMKVKSPAVSEHLYKQLSQQTNYHSPASRDEQDFLSDDQSLSDY